VARMLLASGRPVPWPLAEPKPAGNLVPEGAQTHAGVDDPGTVSLPRPMRLDGRPDEQGDPRPLRSAAPLDRPAHEGCRRAPGGLDRPPDQAPVGTWPARAPRALCGVAPGAGGRVLTPPLTHTDPRLLPWEAGRRWSDGTAPGEGSPATSPCAAPAKWPAPMRGCPTRGVPLYLAVHLPPFTEYSLNHLH
jgi:hypothetical protein